MPWKTIIYNSIIINTPKRFRAPSQGGKKKSERQTETKYLNQILKPHLHSSFTSHVILSHELESTNQNVSPSDKTLPYHGRHGMDGGTEKVREWGRLIWVVGKQGLGRDKLCQPVIWCIWMLLQMQNWYLKSRPFQGYKNCSTVPQPSYKTQDLTEDNQEADTLSNNLISHKVSQTCKKHGLNEGQRILQYRVFS